MCLPTNEKTVHTLAHLRCIGYLKDPDKKGHLVIDEEAAEVVKEVFSLFAEGYGKTAIARILNERGIPNPTEYKRLKGLRYKQSKTKNSITWKYFSIADMLSNEIYIGNMVQGKYGSISYKIKKNKPIPKEKWIIVKGTHEPIIDKCLWDKVQNLLRIKTKPFTTGKIGVFARKVRCANCGYVMRSGISRNKRNFRCSIRHTAKGACVGAFVSYDTLEKTVLNELKKLIDTYLDTNQLTSAIKSDGYLLKRKEKLENDISKLNKKISEFEKAIKDLYFDKVKGLISDEEFLSFSKDFHQQKEKALFDKNEMESKLAHVEKTIQNADSKRKMINQYLNVDKLDRIMVEELIDSILVGRRNPETKELPIQINWNF